MLVLPRFIRIVGVTALFSVASFGVHAEPYPAKQVTIFVPYAASGAVDVLAPTIGRSLSKTSGQQPIIENRPGAGGVIASQALAQSAPDGYKLILVASGHPLNQFFYPKLPYETFKNLTAITEVAYSPLAIVVAGKNDARNLQELLAVAKQKPDSLSYGTSGNGTLAHLGGELLNYMAGVKILAIQYKGGAPALTAVLAGDIPMSINPVPEVVGQLDSGPGSRDCSDNHYPIEGAARCGHGGGIRCVRLRDFGVVGISRSGGYGAGTGGENQRRPPECPQGSRGFGGV